MSTCPFCKSTANELSTLGGFNNYDCSRCGRVSVTDSAEQVFANERWTEREIANASGWLRENQGAQITSHELPFLRALRSPSVDERAEKILLAMERRSRSIGERFNFNLMKPASVSEWLSVSWSANVEELGYLLINYLVVLGFLKGRVPDNAEHLANAIITPTGYAELARLRQGGAGSAIGFCAMWFDARMRPLWTDAIKPAIDDAGYRAERIDNFEHNNKIDDEIIAMIRKSRFVVADFTGNRGGVYFEAGFALGLAIPVIWTIRECRFHRVHFDNRQYNFIGWDASKLPEFKLKLQNRIEATLGAGPLRR